MLRRYEGGTEPGRLGSRNEGQACSGEPSANYLLLSPHCQILDAVRALDEKDFLHFDSLRSQGRQFTAIVNIYEDPGD